jgi:membrane associated rhomboid family serine protease
MCYRHPNREAGRRCTRCGRPACGECLVQAAVGSHCIECAKAARPDLSTRARFWNARQPALVTLILIGVNVAVFVLGAVRDPASISGQATATHRDLALFEPFLADGEWYRLVTSGFLHFGIIHLAFNMYLLYLLGQMLEPTVGRVKFVLVYFAALLGGSAGAILLDPLALTAGASGAVFGLMGLAFVGYWLHGANPFQTSIGTLLVLNLVITFLWSDRISVGGHLGGAIAGAVCAFAVMAPAWKGVPAWVGYAVPIAVSGAAIAVSVLAVG